MRRLAPGSIMIFPLLYLSYSVPVYLITINLQPLTGHHGSIFGKIIALAIYIQPVFRVPYST